MTILEAVQAYFLKNGLAVDLHGLPPEPGGAYLRPVGADPVEKRYLDGSRLCKCTMELWVRRGYGGEGTDGEALPWLRSLPGLLEEATRRGVLPVLGQGKRAWSLRVLSSPAPELWEEDGLLAEGCTLQLIYFERPEEE